MERKYLKDNNIIEKVEGPTPWVSPIVTFPQSNNAQRVRICIEMRLPKIAFKQERHISPTLDDIIHALYGGTLFSKLDSNKRLSSD